MAIALDPGEQDGPNFLALYYQLSGDYERSQALLKTLIDSDPLFFPARTNFGEGLRQTGDPTGAIRQNQKILEQDPNNIVALTSMALASMTVGTVARTREILQTARSVEPQNYMVRLLWALQLAIEGQRAAALSEMDAEVLKYGELIVGACIVAEFYAVLGDRPKALEWLDRAVRVGDERASWFERDPLLANIRQEPRFREIVDGIRSRQQRPNRPSR
jgi:tetratricopeptide (TPR) repeat protein